MTQTVLILGANGRFGRNAAQQFTRAGWDVRRFDRAQDTLGDAARGVDVIVNAWNPVYTDWQKLVAGQTEQVIKTARQTGATVIVPGNVYVFGPQQPGPWSEATPHAARNPLGQVRVEMEAAYRRSGVRTIILRAGDFIDTRASGNWFDKVMIKTLNKGVFTYPGNPDIAHAWAYLPDLCRAAVQLAEMRDSLPVFADIAFPGFTATGAEIASVLAQVTGTSVRVKPMRWLPIQIARPFWRLAGCFLEMRYLWDTAHQLDGALFHSLLPRFKATPLDQALASAIPPESVRHRTNTDQTVATGA